MKLSCIPNVVEVEGILYSLRAYWKKESLSKEYEFVQDPQPVAREVSEEDIFSNHV